MDMTSFVWLDVCLCVSALVCVRLLLCVSALIYACVFMCSHSERSASPVDV